MADDDNKDRITKRGELQIDVDVSAEWERGKNPPEIVEERDGALVKIELVHRTTGEVAFFEFFHKPF